MKKTHSKSISSALSEDIAEVMDSKQVISTMKKHSEISSDLRGNRITMWNSEKDVLITNSETLLKGNDTASSEEYFHWAYSLNTAVGLYRCSEEKNEYIEENLEDGVTFSCSKHFSVDLILDDGKKCATVLENVTVWGTNYHDDFMICSSNVTRQTFLIDSRGKIFELPCVATADKYGNGGNVDIDKRKGCYFINGVKVYFRTPEQRKEFDIKVRTVGDTTFNKDFNRFIRSDAHNKRGYLYLTAGESKCGALVSFFASQGMSYEVVPNFL